MPTPASCMILLGPAVAPKRTCDMIGMAAGLFRYGAYPSYCFQGSMGAISLDHQASPIGPGNN